MPVHGHALRALREKEGYSPDEMAALVGISGPHLRNLENGHRPASREDLNKIARLLGVPIAAISPLCHLRHEQEAVAA